MMPGHSLPLLLVFQHMELKERSRTALVCKASNECTRRACCLYTINAMRPTVYDCATPRGELLYGSACCHDVFSRMKGSVLIQEWHRMLQHPSLWTELNLSNWQNPAPVFEVVKRTEGAMEALRKVNLEFTVGIDDGHLETLSQFPLTAVNLNGCQKCVSQLATQTLQC